MRKMKKTGIWLDKKVAYIISEDLEGHQDIDIIFSKVENYKIRGGSGTRLKGGPQDVVQDKRYLERTKNQLRSYFKKIVGRLNDSRQIVIFGPAETGQKFKKELVDNYESIAALLRDVVITDSMTKNQMKTWARNYFATSNQGVKS